MKLKDNTNYRYEDEYGYFIYKVIDTHKSICDLPIHEQNKQYEEDFLIEFKVLEIDYDEYEASEMDLFKDEITWMTEKCIIVENSIEDKVYKSELYQTLNGEYNEQ